LPELLEPVTPEPGLIVSVGRLERYKGHHKVIAALPEVRKRQPEARLLILGSGPYEVQLRRLADQLGIGPQVEIRAIPPSDRQAMAQTLARAALVVLLSEAESHPVAVMEALLLGRPVLVADTSGLSELARRQLVRAIPLSIDSGAVAAAIAEELQFPTARAEARLPTWDDCAAELLALYQTVVSERPAA
jgi:glycosyltransferase involved in cell wall biosynthesis